MIEDKIRLVKKHIYGVKSYIIKRDRRIAKYLIYSLLALFLLLTAFVFFIPTTFIDIEFSEEIQEDQHPLLNMFMKWVSWFGHNEVAISCIILLALICLIYKYKREAVFVLLTGLASIINAGIKILINRPRPSDDLVNIILEAENQSFPSGHTVHYVVFFGFLIFLMFRMKKLNAAVRIFLGMISLTLIAAVPFSRIYLGVHWFTDVLAGFFLGIILLTILLLFYFKDRKKTSDTN